MIQAGGGGQTVIPKSVRPSQETKSAEDPLQPYFIEKMDKTSLYTNNLTCQHLIHNFIQNHFAEIV